MRTNPALAKLRAGKVAVGPIVVYASPDLAEQIAHMGFDWVWLDWQHGEWTETTLNSALARFLGADTAPIVRVKGLDPGAINHVLDMGAMGVIVPMVQNAAQARVAAQAVYYPPLGQRSGGGTRLGLLSGKDAGDYLAHANEEMVLVVQVETEEAVSNCEEIMRVPGVNAVLIGPGDLMIDVKAHGHDESHHEKLVQEVAQAAKRTGVAAGYFCTSKEEARRRVAEGFRLISYGHAQHLIVSSLQEIRTYSLNWYSKNSLANRGC